MKKLKKLLILLLVSLFVFNTFLISGSAYTEPTSLVGVDLNLEVGRYDGGVFTALTPGEPLYTNDIITVRIAPSTDFLIGVSKFVVMFSKNYLQIEGANKAAFTINTDSPFYAACSDYQGTTGVNGAGIPQGGWPASMVTDGSFAANTAVSVNNNAGGTAPNGGYPLHMTGEWLFRFNLKVKQNITVGSGAKVWMDSRWVKTPAYPAGAMYFTKCLDSTKLSSQGSANYYFVANVADANISLEPAATVNITFDANGGTGGTGPAAMQPGATLTAPTVARENYTFAGWTPAVPSTVPSADTTYTAQWTLNGYTITWDANGGTGGGSNACDHGAMPTPVSAGTRTGYTFTGWSPEIVAATAPATYTAQWTLNSYTITFDADGGTGGSSESLVFGTVLTAPTVAKTGHSFLGWTPTVPDTVPAANTTYTAQWSANSYTITFDANGGTGGTSESLAYGTALTAPAVARPGYVFQGWSPEVPATVPGANTTYVAQWVAVPTYTITFSAGTRGLIEGNTQQVLVLLEGAAIIIPRVTAQKGWGFTGWNQAVPATATANGTYTAQYIKTDVTVTKNLADITVNIAGWEADYSYQIWTYQKVTSDTFLNAASNVPANQWILAQAYTLGSAGDLQLDGSINFTIDPFVSPDNNYTVAVRIVDQNGDFVCELRDTYTADDVQVAEITKVLVDGAYTKGIEFKEIKAGASVLIKVFGNNIPNMAYTATILDTMSTIPVSNTNEFVWDIAALMPREYSVIVTASNGVTTASQTIVFKLYSSDAGVNYGIINSLAIGESSSVLPQTVEMVPNFINGNFYYVVREPGREPAFVSDQYTAMGTIAHSVDKYGIYQVTGYVNRPYINPTENSYDDGIVKMMEIKRSQTIPSSATLTASVGIGHTPVARYTNVLFTATASIGGIGTTPVEYSFWRNDAKGYVLVKDWSADNTLSWTPARVGKYVIEVRAKGEDAGSYEVMKQVFVDVTDTTDEIAQGVVISLNQAELNASAAPRTPITIKASATNTNGDDLLYKFNVESEFIGARTIQNYSADQNCIWTPGKAGIYTVSVLVKNRVSFGQFDAIKKFTVTVD